MTRYIEMPFGELPDKNDTYLLVRKSDLAGAYRYRGTHEALEYCDEGGWNTFKNHKGIVYADSEITAEELEDSYACWLKPVTVGECGWAEEISDLIEEIKAKAHDFADYELTDDEEETLDNLTDLIERLEEAMEIAEAFKK